MSQRLRRELKITKDRSGWRLAGFIGGGALAFALLAGLVLVFLAFRVPSPPEVRLDPESARQLDHDFEQAALNAQSGKSSEVRANETQVNSKTRELLGHYQVGQDNGSVKDLRMKFVADHIEAYILLNYRGRELAVQLSGRIHTSGGYVEFEPQSAKLGELPVPQSRLQTAATDLMNAPGSALRYRLPSNIESVEMENGQVVFKMR